MTDFDTWLHDFGYDHIFRILIPRKPMQYTPYEFDQKFSDESLYVDNHYKKVIIDDAVELPDGDIMIGFREVYDKDVLHDSVNHGDSPILFKKLSEVELSYFPQDEKENNEYEEEY